MLRTQAVNILMIEDNPGDQVLLQELIRSSNIRFENIYTATTLRQAFQLLTQHPIDIILLDLTLPDSYGITTFRAIRDNAGRIPVVILSGVSDMNVALEAITLGAQDFLLKGEFDEKLLTKSIFYSIERMHNLQALRESNERFNLVSRATNDMVWDWNIITGEVFRNKEGFRKILNTVAPLSETGTEADWDGRIHPDDQARVQHLMEHIKHSVDQDIFEFEYRVRRDDERYAYILDRGYIIRNESGRAVRMIGASQDITEKKLSAIRLADSEKRFRSLIENTWDGLAIIDGDGYITDFSPSGKRILGYTREVAIGMNSLDLVHPDHRRLLQDVLNGIVQHQESASHIELLMRKSDGTYTWLEATLHNQLMEQAISGIVVNYHDITERKKAERVVKQSEERYRYLFDNNPASIIIWDLQTYNVLEVNEATIRQSGFSREELLSQSVLTGLAENPEYIYQMAQDALGDPHYKQTNITRLYNKQGEKMYVEFASHRIEYNGRPSILALGNNVTKRVLLEKQLNTERIKKQQEITNAVISAQENERQEIGRELHDNINQILASSRLYLGLAQSETGMYRSFLNKADTLINSAIDEIRGLSHSLIPPPLHESELTDALDQIIDTTSRVAELSISRNMNGFDERDIDDKFKLAIFRIVQEQFTNIQKHAKATAIDFSLQRIDDRVILSVRDNGVGFDATKKSPGVGLLNIRTRASLFNGSVTINTAPGKGCELLVIFTPDT